MALTHSARDFIVGLLTGTETGPLFDNANAYVGVGDSTTLFAPEQRDLQAPANKFRKKVDPGFPTRVGNVMTFQSTFAPEEANFTWNEWGVFNQQADGVMLNRVVEYNGIKVVGQSWVFQVELILNVK